MHRGLDRYAVSNMSCQPLALFAGGSQIGLGTGLAISVFFFTGLSVLSLFNLTHAVVRHQWSKQLCCKLEPGTLTASTPLPALQWHTPEAGCRVHPASLAAGSKREGRNHVCWGGCLCAGVRRLCKHEKTSGTTFGLHLCSCSFFHSQMVGGWVTLLFLSIWNENSLIYHRFSNELKETLFHCTEKKAEAFPQVCNAIFSNVLHHGFGVLGADVTSCHKRSRSTSKWLNHLTAYLKVILNRTVWWATVNIVSMCSLVQLMRTLPLSAMHHSVLTRSLVAVTVWHISTAQLIMVGFNISLTPGYLLLLPL